MRFGSAFDLPGLHRRNLWGSLPLGAPNASNVNQALWKKPVSGPSPGGASGKQPRQTPTPQNPDKPSWGRRALTWLLQGGPLYPQMTQDERVKERELPLKERFYAFLKRRKISGILLGLGLLPVAGMAFSAGENIKRVIPVTPGEIMARGEHPIPWDDVKVYASVPQNDVSHNYFFQNKGGIFTTKLMYTLEQTPSLQKAFEVMKRGYGEIYKNHQSVASAEGPQIFDKTETKSRKALLIVGGGVNDAGQDFTGALRMDIDLVKETLKKGYQLKTQQDVKNPEDAEIIVLDQPQLSEFQETLKKLAQNPPEELLIYVVGEGAALDDFKVPLTLISQEGSKLGCFDLNRSSALDEYDFKRIIHENFYASPQQAASARPKIAIVGDFCGSGALIQ